MYVFYRLKITVCKMFVYCEKRCTWQKVHSYAIIASMGLDFTTIKDKPGSAIYLIHDGTQVDEMKFKVLADDMSKRTDKQVVTMSMNDENASKVINFYQLRGTHFVIIVRDDDQLHHVWSDGELFDAAQIAYFANQAG